MSWSRFVRFAAVAAVLGVSISAGCGSTTRVVTQTVVKPSGAASASLEVRAKRYYLSHLAKFTIPPTREVRHIEVNSKSLADQIETKLRQGASFAALAEKYSEDTGSARKGGKLCVAHGDHGGACGLTVPPFDKASFSLKTNEISQPVHSVYGWHIIQALSPIRPAHQMPYAAVHAKVVALLKAKAKATAVRKAAKRAAARAAAQAAAQPATNSAPAAGGSIYYQPGYPKRVPASQTPEQMSDYLRTGGITTAIAAAPGVWVYDAPGATIHEDVAAGDLIGWCGSVQAFVDENPDLQSGSTCW